MTSDPRSERAASASSAKRKREPSPATRWLLEHIAPRERAAPLRARLGQIWRRLTRRSFWRRRGAR